MALGQGLKHYRCSNLTPRGLKSVVIKLKNHDASMTVCELFTTSPLDTHTQPPVKRAAPMLTWNLCSSTSPDTTLPRHRNQKLPVMPTGHCLEWCSHTPPLWRRCSLTWTLTKTFTRHARLRPTSSASSSQTSRPKPSASASRHGWPLFATWMTSSKRCRFSIGRRPWWSASRSCFRGRRALLPALQASSL